ncbi:SAAL1 protein, partial [Amia calva]|nr:SAAL1 protein [Amia calva]
MDRNPSPPPRTSLKEEEEEEEERDRAEGPGAGGDAIGDTVYSKHWLFSTLSRLIEVVREQDSADPEAGGGELGEKEEEELCRVWDMAMDQDVAGFLQEFRAAEILLGVIAKSRSARLTEICVGILGNMACFPEPCLSISKNKDLGAVLLLLLEDSDPPTLLETCRLLLTCVSQASVAPCWLARIRQQASVCQSLCFIMSSSTSVELLVKVGELVHKLFDLDEDLMREWVSLPAPSAEPQSALLVAPCLLEAAKQLRSESPEGLEVYVHTLQLLTTVEEGVQALVEQAGEGVWSLLSGVVTSDLCQPDDPALVLLEQRSLLTPALAVLGVLFCCPDRPAYCSPHSTLPLVASLLRLLQYLKECQQKATESREEGEVAGQPAVSQAEDQSLQFLSETATDFLSSILSELSQESVLELVRSGALTEDSGVCAAQSLQPQHSATVQHLSALLSCVDPQLFASLAPHCPRPWP